jgi:CheY-like chemotaxis protein
MKDEELKTLFDEYSRFNKIANRKTEGTGLGMNITGRLVEIMNGEISVKSEFAVGSTFTVTLPQKNPSDMTFITPEEKALLCTFSFHTEAKTITKIAFEYMPYGKVLIVDDVETNLFVAEGLIKPYGISAETAKSGKAAIEIINSGASFDIIFMDHMMPEMDGIEATAILRNSGYDKPIVALTANAVSGQRQMFLDNGFDEFISKPIDIAALDRILCRYVRDKHPEEARKFAGQTKASSLPEISADEKKHEYSPKLINAFLRDAEKALLSMPAQLEKKDLKNFAISAHGMKSGLLGIGEEKCSEIAKKLEFAAKSEHLSEIKENFTEFINALEEITQKLKSKISAERLETVFTESAVYTEFVTDLIRACNEYDNNEAKKHLSNILSLSLPSDVKETIENAEILIFHAEFEEAAELLEGIFEKIT